MRKVTGEKSLSELWDNIRWINIHVIGISEGREVRKTICRNDGWALSNFDENTKPTDTRNSKIPKKKKPIKNHTKPHHNQARENQWESMI